MTVKDPSERALAVTQPDNATRDDEIMEALVIGQGARHLSSSHSSLVIVGELIGVQSDDSIALVRYDTDRGPATAPARSTIDVHTALLGRRVVLAFEGGDSSKPIILGVLGNVSAAPRSDKTVAFEVELDGETVLLSAHKQLVLRCGKASITLTDSGKVLIQGEYVSTRAATVNRIRGGSVQIN